MHSRSTPIFKDVVLAGGGHAHALLIRQWGMQPIPGVRLTLVSPGPLTPYSGMLPGLIAGHYSFDDIHIDLVRLCHWANVRFIISEVTSIDPAKKLVRLQGRADVAFDVLSIDTGSTPSHDVPGVQEHAIGIKPIAGFWQRWNSLVTKIQELEKTQSITVVGGGAGSVESVLAMAWACRKGAEMKVMPEFNLVFQDDVILPGYPVRVRKAAEFACKKLGITLHANFKVCEVSQDSLSDEEGTVLKTDHVFWCVQASAPQWPSASGLACNEEGFIAVNEFLQSTNHPGIFAAGDIAFMHKNPRPKAGVYAVRQAPYLLENISNFLLNTPMKAYIPQDRFLSLLALGEKRAAGNRGPFTSSGRWVWRLKDRIDRGFMERFKHYPVHMGDLEKRDISDALIPEDEKSEQLDPAARCGGCGAKVGGQVLQDVLAASNTEWQPEDASIIQWPESSIAQSVDLIKAPFDDPWLMGRIAVFHALNDLLAMNATPHSMQVVLTLPFAGREIQSRELHMVMEGIKSACLEERVYLAGGHTGEGDELTVCLTANGIPGSPGFSKKGAKKGDFLVTNKPLGSGIVLAGLMSGHTQGPDLAETLVWMNSSNTPLLPVLAQLGVQTCTDISGFALLGHLSELLMGTELGVELYVDAIPIQSGVKPLIEAGIKSSLFPQNLQLVQSRRWVEQYLDSPLLPVLLDPQTSGGILALVPEQAKDRIKGAGLTIIGQIC
ncbi:MAG: selenide, water dikinase SelD [Gammaproteobacteria bacterium]|jgi:selenide,water dikinase|nr:selenide, water dikinase SelD [Gammaproteobacteria bacterium]MBT6043356.1 selenide, water dikinase SelD [Gammaproteobacteria bacterium]